MRPTTNQRSTAASALDRVSRVCSIPLMCISVAIILVATLYPFIPRPLALANAAEWLALAKDFIRTSSGRADRINNVLLFLPLGFGLASLFVRARFRGRWLVAALLCTLLSFSIECIQIWLPSRAPTAMDVITNTSGGVFGIVGFVLMRWFCSNRLRFTLVATAAFGLLLVLLVPLQRAARFSNWNYSYSLSVGNNLAGSKPWSGTIRTLGFSTAAVSAQQLQQLSSTGDAQSLQWLARYDFTAPPYLADHAGQQHDLVAAQPVAATPQGIALAGKQFLALTPDTTTPIVAAFQQADRLTMLLQLAPSGVQQGHIVMIGDQQANGIDFDISQAGRDLVVRLRTPATGGGGTPALVARDLFDGQAARQIALNYQRGQLRLAVDGQLRVETLRVTPAEAFFSLLLPARANVVLARYPWVPPLYGVVFNCAVFGSYGLAVALWLPAAWPRLCYWLAAGGASIVAALAYGAIVLASGGIWPPLMLSCLQVAIALAATGSFALILALPIRPAGQSS